MTKKSKNGSKSKQNKKATTKIESIVQHRLYEGVFILMLALSAYLLLSFVTFHASEASKWHTLISSYNAGGKAGAAVSSVFFYTFGYIAYLFPVMLVLGSISLLKPKENLKSQLEVIGLKLLGLVFLMLSLCGLASLLGLHIYQPLPRSGGGLIGIFIAQSLFTFFHLAGSFVLLIGFTLLGLTLITNISWLHFIEKVGSNVVHIARYGIYICQRTIALLQWLWGNLKHIKPKTPLENAVKVRVKSSKKVIKTKSIAEDEELEQLDDFFGTPPKPAKLKVSERYQKERQQPLFSPKGNESLPSLSLLSLPVKKEGKRYTHTDLETRSREVEQRLLDFGVEVNVVAVHPGPVITRFELQLAAGLKVSKITALGKDLARSLSVISVRVVEVIPGKSVVGLELPNEQRDIVCLSEVLATEAYDKVKSPLALALGVDIAGAPVIVDLAKMPHLLVAGTTGSGKSVGINAMLLSLLFKATPDEVRLIMVDPKMLELSVYEGIPHLLTPVVTDMKDAASALRWSVMEMERRYRLMAALGVRNIAGFNKKVKDAISKDAPIKDPLWKGLEEENAPTLTSLPSIVIVIDELADMMMVVGKKVEQLIARIAQKARAAGIHLILATQRPSVDVLTGLIKSNIPTRIAFQVSSKIDSRTILDQQGAEQLLGHGDMLYLAPGSGAPIRIHGAFVEDNEVHRVADAWRELGEPDYIEAITQVSSEGEEFGLDGDGENKEEVDALYDDAIAFVTQARKASISSVQRRFKIGYNRAARLIEEMERTGVVGPMEGGSREVLAPPPPSE